MVSKGWPLPPSGLLTHVPCVPQTAARETTQGIHPSKMQVLGVIPKPTMSDAVSKV